MDRGNTFNFFCHADDLVKICRYWQHDECRRIRITDESHWDESLFFTQAEVLIEKFTFVWSPATIAWQYTSISHVTIYCDSLWTPVSAREYHVPGTFMLFWVAGGTTCYPIGLSSFGCNTGHTLFHIKSHHRTVVGDSKWDNTLEEKSALETVGCSGNCRP